MTILESLAMFWMLINVIGAVALTIACFTSAEYFDRIDLLVYPMLVRFLREKLSILGTVIVTALFSVLFVFALILYFTLLSCFTVASLMIECFIYIFRRKD